MAGLDTRAEQYTERLRDAPDVPLANRVKRADIDAVDALFSEAEQWTKTESAKWKSHESAERVIAMREEFRAVDTQLKALEAKEGRSTEENKELLRLQVDSARLINVYRQQFAYSDRLDKTGARLGYEGMRQTMNKAFGIRLPVYQEALPFQPTGQHSLGIDFQKQGMRTTIARMQLYAWKDIGAALSRVKTLDAETRKRLIQEGTLERRAFATTHQTAGASYDAALTEIFQPMLHDAKGNMEMREADFTGLPDITWTDGTRHSGEVLRPSAFRSSNNWLNALVIDKLAREQGLYDKTAA